MKLGKDYAPTRPTLWTRAIRMVIGNGLKNTEESGIKGLLIQEYVRYSGFCPVALQSSSFIIHLLHSCRSSGEDSGRVSCVTEATQ